MTNHPHRDNTIHQSWSQKMVTKQLGEKKAGRLLKLEKDHRSLKFIKSS